MVDWIRCHRFTILLSTLLLLFGMQTLTTELSFHEDFLQCFYSLLLAAAVLVIAQQKVLRRVLILLASLALAASWGLYFCELLANDWWEAQLVLNVVDRLVGILFLSLSAAVIVRHVSLTTEVDLDTLIGAVCAYLLLGIAWSMAYAIVNFLVPGSFHANLDQIDLGRESLHSGLWTYYSFVAMTTLGLGDITPVAPIARTLTWMQAMVGQLYIAILVARLVALHVTPSVPDAET